MNHRLFVQEDRKNQESIDFLAEVDHVKENLEACARTISEVENWQDRTRTIEKAFDNRDLVKVSWRDSF